MGERDKSDFFEIGFGRGLGGFVGCFEVSFERVGGGGGVGSSGNFGD